MNVRKNKSHVLSLLKYYMSLYFYAMKNNDTQMNYPCYNLCFHLINVNLFCMFGSGFDEERPEVSMLFRDVPSLLIIFVLTMPQPLRKGTIPMSGT